jgi:hypothetical protein
MSSSDNGRFWTTHNINELKTTARYVAAPLDDVIYITAGEWPQQKNQKSVNSFPYSARWTLSQHAASDRVSAIPTYGSLKDKSSADTPTAFKMQIVKSTDGGETWTSQVYSETLGLYFNDIACYDQLHCCAAAEGTGIAVYCTADGNNWNQVYQDADENLSLMAAAYIGPQEIWMGGSNLSGVEGNAVFLHSVDGGKTWEVTGTDVYGQFPNDLSFVSKDRAWASTFNVEQESGLLEFKNWNAKESFLQ